MSIDEEIESRMKTMGELLVVQFPGTVFSLTILSEGDTPSATAVRV